MMTEYEYLEGTRLMIGDDPEAQTQDLSLLQCVSVAKNRVLARLYPFDAVKEDIPSRYDTTVCQIAAYLWNKRGAEGQTSHSENGISRGYESGDIPDSMLNHIMPFCGVIG